MTGPFGLHAERLANYGYEPIPISLPSDGGNSPGKRPALPGWQNGLAREHWQAFARCGLGVLTRSTPALDIDVLDQELAEKIQRIAERALGDAPYRIGRAPKRLLPYRLDGEPFPKMKVTWLDAEGTEHAVELLADGQQFVAFGDHSATGQPYVWHRAPDLEIPRGLLPAVDRATAERFMRARAGALERQGAANVTLTGVVDTPAAQAAPLARPVANGEHPATPFLAKIGSKVATTRATSTDAERITAALARMGNPDRHYDEWIRIGLAIKAGLGEGGLPVWLWWSSQSSKYDERLSRKKWATFKPGKISAGTIFWEAGR